MENYFSSDFQEIEYIHSSIKKYEEMISKGQNSFFEDNTLTDFCRRYRTSDNDKRVLDIVNYILTTHSQDIDLLAFKAKILLYLNKKKEAETILKVISEEKYSSVTLVEARALFNACQKEKAITLLNELIEKNSDDFSLLAEVGRIYVEYNEYDKATDLLKPLFTAQIEHNECRKVFTECCLKQHLTENIVKKYIQLIDKNPYSYYLWEELGHIYFEKEKYNKAIHAYEYALTIKDNPSTMIMIAQSYFKLTNYYKAREYFYQCLDNSPNILINEFLIGVCSYHFEKYENSLKYLKGVLEKTHDNLIYTIEILDYIITIYYKMYQFKKALPYVEEALERYPDSAILHAFKGKVLFGIKRGQEGDKCFAKALELDGDNLKVLHVLSKSYFDYKKYKQSLACLMKINEIVPNDPDNLLFIASVQAILEYVDESIENFNIYYKLQEEQQRKSVESLFYNYEENEEDYGLYTKRLQEISDIINEDLEIGEVEFFNLN